MTKSNSLFKRRSRLAYGAMTFGFAMALSLAAAPTSHAAGISGPRDCTTNSLNNKPLHGGCGAVTPTELIEDVRVNDPGDLQAIYADSRMGGLVSSKYERFASNARMGTAYKNGNIVVDGKTVMTNASSIGRHSFPGQTTPVKIGDRTYYMGANSATFQQPTIPVMVMFDDAGVAETAILTACGNPVIAKKVIPEKKVIEKEVVVKEIVKEEKKEVKPPPELPKAGPEGMAGIFAGTSALGALAHGFVTSQRRSRKKR
jgi:hypothetical protein